MDAETEEMVVWRALRKRALAAPEVDALDAGQQLAIFDSLARLAYGKPKRGDHSRGARVARLLGVAK